MSKIKNKGYIIAFASLALALIVVEILNFVFEADGVVYQLIYGTLTRAIGAAICVVMMLYCDFDHLFSLKAWSLKSLLLISPCCLIAINNFPFIAIANGTARLNTEWYLVLLLVLQCFFVGLFEEVAFRGCVFMLILERKHKTLLDVFLSIIFSSLIFGGIHIVNLIAGAGIVPVMLQLGYSFLIGAMCAVVLLVTKRIWMSVLIHAAFNFAGALVPTLGSGAIWNTPTVILTVVVSVAVAIYTVALFLKFDVSKVDELFSSDKSNK